MTNTGETMSLRDNLHVLRVDDEDPRPNIVFKLVLVQGGIELRRESIAISTEKPRYTWELPGNTHEQTLRTLEEVIRDLEIAFNIYRLQIYRIEPLSRGRKPQLHVQDVLQAVLAGMRHWATLGCRRELAVASVGSVATIVVRTQVIDREVAQIAAAREAGHPAVPK
jgi:hypothetical protein